MCQKFPDVRHHHDSKTWLVVSESSRNSADISHRLTWGGGRSISFVTLTICNQEYFSKDFYSKWRNLSTFLEPRITWRRRNLKRFSYSRNFYVATSLSRLSRLNKKFTGPGDRFTTPSKAIKMWIKRGKKLHFLKDLTLMPFFFVANLLIFKTFNCWNLLLALLMAFH